MSETNLPFGSEFSPSQTELPILLEICFNNSGQKQAIEKSILERYFAAHGRNSRDNRKKLAMNCRIGLKAYGIIDEESSITDLGKELYALRDNEQKLYAVFAKHILLNLNGMSFVQCIRDMTIALEEINLTSLRSACAERGLFYPSGGKHPSIMRLWLEKAGVFVGKRWQIDNDKIKEILGAEDDMDSLRHLTKLQRYFLQALINTDKTTPQPANQIVKLAEMLYGLKFPEKSLPKEVLNVLVDYGYITATKTTTGRGAKPFLVAPTERAHKEILIPLLEQLKGQTDPKLIELQCKSILEILDNLKSENRYVAGLALEALAFKLMRILGMDYIATRLRGESTGGAEVDLIFESSRMVFSRWQVQCKNTAHISLEDVAKEVGLTQLLKSNVIVVVSTGRISEDARKYSNVVMKDTNLCIVMIDGEDIAKIANNPVDIVDVFEREAKSTMALKKLNV